ncbi:pyrroloquinoline quinone precursor peptide PqqA [Neoroseomonas marina]|nr:pyrroloquinoline quinone precursor peptide PqqA [Neoroseomonas marina]
MSRPADAILGPSAVRRHLSEEASMAWKTPKIVEISLALEINSYACADVD